MLDIKMLASVFNINNYDIVDTNFSVQDRDNKRCIVISFDKNMNRYQCISYLQNIKKKIVCEFYDIKEEDIDVVLNTAELIFDVKSFPFDTSKGEWCLDKDNNRLEFVTPIDRGIIFNLKSHLAASLAKDVREDMPTCNMYIKVPDKEGYLWQGRFSNKRSCKEFEKLLSSRTRERYKNVPREFLEIKNRDVYIKDIFNDTHLIDSIMERAAWLIGCGLQADSKNRSDVKAFKDLIIEFIDQAAKLTVIGFMCAPPLNGKVPSIIVPVVQGNEGARLLKYEEALDLNDKFGNIVFNNINDKTRAKLSIEGKSGIYGIDFSNKEISHCVINKIIESSVINENHELTISPELCKQSLLDVPQAESGYSASSDEQSSSADESDPKARNIGSWGKKAWKKVTTKFTKSSPSSSQATTPVHSSSNSKGQDEGYKSESPPSSPSLHKNAGAVSTNMDNVTGATQHRTKEMAHQ